VAFGQPTRLARTTHLSGGPVQPKIKKKKACQPRRRATSCAHNWTTGTITRSPVMQAARPTRPTTKIFFPGSFPRAERYQPSLKRENLDESSPSTSRLRCSNFSCRTPAARPLPPRARSPGPGPGSAWSMPDTAPAPRHRRQRIRQPHWDHCRRPAAGARASHLPPASTPPTYFLPGAYKPVPLNEVTRPERASPGPTRPWHRRTDRSPSLTMPARTPGA